MSKDNKIIPPKHQSCNYFDEFVTYLQNEVSGFKLETLADEIGCSTERIRRIRIGMVMMDVNDITVLKDKYNANPLFLVDHIMPMTFAGSALQLVNEATAQYGSPLATENKHLKETIAEKDKQLKDKDKIIGLYESRFLILEKGKKRA